MLEERNIFDRTSPERRLARTCGTCTIGNDCDGCNCPARASLACQLLRISPAEILETLQIPRELKKLVLSLPRGTFEFELGEELSGHNKRFVFHHPKRHKLNESKDEDL